MLLEYDLCDPTGPESDLKLIAQGKGILLKKTSAFIRILMWTDNFTTPLGAQIGPGFQVVDYLCSEDPIHDSDIILNGVRYCTQSGMKIRAFFPDREEARVPILGILYRRLRVRISPRAKLQNRITEFLT